MFLILTAENHQLLLQFKFYSFAQNNQENHSQFIVKKRTILLVSKQPKCFLSTAPTSK